MNQNRAMIVAGALLTVAIGALWSASPAAAASDDPTPYTVTTAGVTLPAGTSFPDGGHVNIRTTAGDRGIHFESLNGQPSGQWIGQSVLPWSAFGLTCGFEVTWVQVSLYDEHYGEGGQSPLAVPCPPADPPVEVCWDIPAGGSDQNVTWPQTLNPTCVPPCERWVQADTYPTSAVAGLTADGILDYKEDWGIAIQWRFIHGGECTVVTEAPVTPPAEPLPPALALTGYSPWMPFAAVGAVLAILVGLIVWAFVKTWAANHQPRHRAEEEK